MCQQSLINYLHTELNKGTASYQQIGQSQTSAFGNEAKKGQLDLTIEHRSNPKISKEDIETLIKFGEQVGENEAAVLLKNQNIAAGKQQTTTLSSKLSESIRENANRIDDALANITVCDPAIGSGAFPVGMMHEIVKTRNLLRKIMQPSSVTQAASQSHSLEKYEHEHGQDARDTYKFKRECIEKSLYGVDIDPGAVEIAKLRLWLSLVVDEEDIRNIKPLPNLDYKIVCGNSLLGYPYTPRGLEKVEILKNQFINEARPTEKNALRVQINNAIFSLFKNTKKSLGYKVNFDFKVNFSEVFHNKMKGFNVVIGNPPYGILNKRQNKEKSIVISKEELSFFKNGTYYAPGLRWNVKYF